MSTTIGCLMLASCFTSSIGRRLQSDAIWRWNPYAQGDDVHEIVKVPVDEDIIRMRQMRHELKKGLSGTPIIRPDGIDGSEKDKRTINWWVNMIGTSRQQGAFEELAKISKWYYELCQGDKQKWIIDQLASSSAFKGEGAWGVLIDTIYALRTAMNRPNFGELLKRLAIKWYKSIDKGLRLYVLNGKINDAQDNLTQTLPLNVRWGSRDTKEKVKVRVVNCLVRSFIFERYRKCDTNYHIKVQLVSVFRKGRMTVWERKRMLNERHRRLVANYERRLMNGN